jgi:hypothetical protein
MADYGFADPRDVASTNPYLMPQQAPDWRQVIGNALLGVGAGISNADASGRGWGAGIGPGLLMGSQMTQQQQQQLYQRQLQAAQWQQMEAYRKAQEENIRSQIEERKLSMGIDKGILGQLGGGGGQTAAPPGMGYQSPPAQLGPDFKKAGQEKVDYLVKNHGLSPVAAATVVGNLYQESGFKPTAVGDGGTAYGQAQWRGDRQAGLVNFAQAQGKPPSDPNVQLDYLVTEMKGGDMGAQRAYAGIQQAKTPQEAAAAMMHFFRPAGYTPANPTAGHGYQQRVQYAQALLPNGQPVPVGEGGPPGSPAGPGGAMAPAQQALNLPPGASAGLDPLSQQMLLSKRFGPLGQARITNQNQQRTQALEEQKFLEQQRANAEKQALDEANAKVDPRTRQPNKPLMETEAQIAAAAAKAKADAELESQGATKLVEKAVTEFVDKERPKGLAIQETIPNIHNVRRLVEAGAITGSGTETRNALAQLASTLGFKSNEAALTPSYLAALADQIVANAKALGVNPTNRDNEIIARAKGADPNVSKEGVLQLLDVQEQMARRAHERYTAEAKRVLGLRSVKQAYGEDYFMLPEPPKYEDWSRVNPLPTQAVSSPAAAMMPAGARSAPSPTPAATIPRAAIKHLMMNPKLVDEFELKYGPGTADAVLRGGR